MGVQSSEFEELYVTERPGLLRRAARRLGSTAVAADIVQDVFLRLWERRSAAADAQPGHQGAYLGRSVSNAIIDHIRAERVRNDYVAGITEEQYAAPVPTPLDILVPRDEIRRIGELARMLPERTRHVFLLNKVHGCKYSEIAEALGISRSAVEKHVARAMVACMGMRE